MKIFSKNSKRTLRSDERNAVDSTDRRSDVLFGKSVNRSNTTALMSNYIGRFADILADQARLSGNAARSN
ncbi:hypothetical protein COU78_03665 [Candidatus Peregrinibacteria bacterium CG10_big_fil_rev_8_21_14_0_10_49_24]|nr:MAG: hypothetical protein COV83_05485 [Candidatus Peregrinibacteria bacterium CG11_big_fil_rev_8_21_14_0_20_49_14]PIR51218.1 MAG: hypothetical protein COU78_03665 [Candidatus Peregrinibacteria bacterium CG10_big_fil_rev_8_21_14_0_10_49_24]PJA67256.1 MAG: hypothetical protein CO157_05820 [Candidatus Peregrinibacteria bacterium CG_4_9_14_3_um_filter_49_12]